MCISPLFFLRKVDLLERGSSEGALTGIVLLTSVLNAVRRLRGDAAKRRVLDLVGGSEDNAAMSVEARGR